MNKLIQVDRRVTYLTFGNIYLLYIYFFLPLFFILLAILKNVQDLYKNFLKNHKNAELKIFQSKKKN